LLEEPTDTHFANMWLCEWYVNRFNNNLVHMYDIFEKTNKIRNSVLIISENKIVQIFKEKIDIQERYSETGGVNDKRYSFQWLAMSEIKRQLNKLKEQKLVDIDNSGRYPQLVITESLIDYIKKHLNQDGY